MLCAFLPELQKLYKPLQIKQNPLQSRYSLIPLNSRDCHLKFGVYHFPCVCSIVLFVLNFILLKLDLSFFRIMLVKFTHVDMYRASSLIFTFMQYCIVYHVSFHEYCVIYIPIFLEFSYLFISPGIQTYFLFLLLQTIVP